MITENFILLFAVLVPLLFGVAFIYAFFLGRSTERDADAIKRAEKIISDSTSKASAIINEASSRSKQMLEASDKLSFEVNEELKDTVRKTIEAEIAVIKDSAGKASLAHEQVFKSLQEELNNHAREVATGIKKAGEESINEFRASLRAEEQTTLYFIQKRLNQEFEGAHLEIQNYKQEQLRRVEESIDKIVISLSEEILGSALSLEKHEKLVLEALNKAKEKGFFNI